MARADYLQECLEDWRLKAKVPAVKPQEFRDLYCSVCRNPDCVQRGAGSPFERRVADQFERLTRPAQADPTLAKYSHIVSAKFMDMTREAMRLEIADRRGDWEPVEVPEFNITDGQPQVARPSSTEVVDHAIRSLAQAKGLKGPDLPVPPETDPNEYTRAAEDALAAERDPELWGRAQALAGKKAHLDDYVQAIYDRLAQSALPEPEPEPEPEQVLKAPAPNHPKRHAAPPRPRALNAPEQGGMLDGSTTPAEPEYDPWAVSPQQGIKVNPGATIRLNPDGTIDDG